VLGNARRELLNRAAKEERPLAGASRRFVEVQLGEKNYCAPALPTKDAGIAAKLWELIQR
jgi:hypothetical protein